MNWIKTLWDKLVNKTSVSPTLVVVEEVDETDAEAVAAIFTQLCIDAGVGRKWVIRYDMAAAFVEWYEGPAEVEDIRNSIADFKHARPDMAPNLVRLKQMPYKRVGKCVYKKKRDGSQGEKKGCSKSVAMAKKYLKALYAVEEVIREELKKFLHERVDV